MKNIKTLESINLEDVPGFNNNNKHYKKSSPTNPSLTDLGVYDLEIPNPTKRGPYDNGHGIRTLISTTPHPHTSWPKIFDNGQKLTVEFRTKLSFWDLQTDLRLSKQKWTSHQLLIPEVTFLVSSPQLFKCYKINVEQRLAPMSVLICTDICNFIKLSAPYTQVRV